MMVDDWLDGHESDGRRREAHHRTVVVCGGTRTSTMSEESKRERERERERSKKKARGYQIISQHTRTSLYECQRDFSRRQPSYGQIAAPFKRVSEREEQVVSPALNTASKRKKLNRARRYISLPTVFTLVHLTNNPTKEKRKRIISTRRHFRFVSAVQKVPLI